MTGKQYLRHMRALDLNHSAMARAFGISRFTSMGWGSGKRPVPAWVDLAIEALYARKEKGTLAEITSTARQRQLAAE